MKVHYQKSFLLIGSFEIGSILFMGQFGGYYKGEKKKPKKSKEKEASFWTAPTFTPPEIVGRGKKR